MSEEPLEYEAQEPLPYIPYTSFQQDAPVAAAIQPAERAVLVSPEPSLPVVSDKVHRKKKSRIGLWVAVIFIVLILASVSALFTTMYSNRSTPNQTLDTFCSALRQKNYQSAYNQFSPKLQKTFSESMFASNFSGNPVTTCTYTAVKDNGSSVTTSMKIVHGYAGTNNDMITLIANSDHEWKIDDFYRL